MKQTNYHNATRNIDSAAEKVNQLIDNFKIMLEGQKVLVETLGEIDTAKILEVVEREIMISRNKICLSHH